MDGIRADVAVGVEQRGQLVQIDPLARREAGNQLPDAKGRERSLGNRIDGGDQKLGLAALALKRVKGREAFGGRAKGRRAAVVGKAIPGREAEDFELRREIARRVGEVTHRRFVRCDEDRTALRRTREVRCEPRQKAIRHAGKRQRLIGMQDPLQRVLFVTGRACSPVDSGHVIHSGCSI